MTTPLTRERHNVLSVAYRYIDTPIMLRDDNLFSGRVARCRPRRKPPFDDTVGRALEALGDWLTGPFPSPMAETVRLIHAALGIAPCSAIMAKALKPPAPRAVLFSSRRSPAEAAEKRCDMDRDTPGWRDLRYDNGAPVYAADGTMLDDKGHRSIFDDVDE